jgi:hypothetical protein
MSRGCNAVVLSRESAKPVEDGKRERPQDALLADMDLPYQQVFYPLGYAVEVSTNDAVVLEIADECFNQTHSLRPGLMLRVNIGVTEGKGVGCPREPIRREYNHLFSLVADADNQALLDLNTFISFAWVTQDAVRNRLYFRYNFLEKVVYLLLGSSVVTDLHAACVGRNNRGILLCGNSGAGKSTLAYGCAREGWIYTSDDTSYLINDSVGPRVIGHAHRVRFRPDAKRLFAELVNHEVSPRLEGKPSIEVPVAELPIISTANEADVYSIVYLKRYSSARGKLVRLPEGTATQRMREALYSAGEVRARHEKILGSLYAVPTYELHYCNLEDAIRELEKLA